MNSSTSTMLNLKTGNFPNGVMGSLDAELKLMGGFISAFILAFAIWCVAFKYFTDKEDKARAKFMMQNAGRMREDMTRPEGVVGPTGMAVEGSEADVLGEERTL